MADQKGVSLAILGVVAVIAVVGLVLLFSSQITGKITFPSNRGAIPSLDSSPCPSGVYANEGPQWEYYSTHPSYLCDTATKCCYNKNVKVDRR